MIIKRAIRKCIRVFSGCELLYKTKWYKSLFADPDHKQYPDNYWYREHNERNFDLVNLGSSGARWAFDYENFPVKAMNWAQQPQTLLEDYNLLRHFHSILKKGGYVLITIMPFTGLNKKTGIMDALKYVKFDLQGEPIEPYLFEKARRVAAYPCLLKKSAGKGLLRYLLHKEIQEDVTPMSVSNPMSQEELEANALMFVNGWKNQFSISDFEAPLTEENKEGRSYRINLMQKLIDFCKERGYKPVYVIPPVTKHLSRYYTPIFEQTYVYGFLKSVNRDIPMLDYSKEEQYQNDQLYFNSFFLNKKGRKMFTQRVLTDMEII
jgi:hypothetical protein